MPKYTNGVGRVETGVSGVDELLEGGIPKGSLVLLAGHTGTGRKTFGLQYLYHGIKKKNEPGIYISLEKDPLDVLEGTKSFGWNMEELVKQKKLSIIKPDLQRFDTLKKTIEDEVDRTGAKRVVISPFSYVSAYFEDVYEVRKAISSLRNQMRTLGCTALAITDIKEGDQAYSSTGFEEFVANGIIVLDLIFKKDSGSYVRTVFIRKMEKTNHSLKLIPIEITAEGIKAYPDAEVF